MVSVEDGRHNAPVSGTDGALRIVQRGHGGPGVLTAEGGPVPAPGAGEIVVRTLAAAVNYSDLMIRRGDWPIRRPDPWPYQPGLEVVGEVAAVGRGGARFAPGDVVVSMMQGMGGVRAERPGGYAEFVALPADAAASVPRAVDPLVAAAVGLAGVTAQAGLDRLGPLDGATVVVTGAGGGVGSLAVRIAVARGARVRAVVSAPGRAGNLADAGAEVVPAADLDRLRGSCDAVLDAVAGPLFAAAVGALRPGGRYSLVGAAAGGTVTWDVFALLDGLTLTGWSSESLDGDALRALWQPLMTLVAEGRLAVPAPTLVPLAEAAHAHRLLEARAVTGRVLLTTR
jgi:NADPH2:quinone reductase